MVDVGGMNICVVRVIELGVVDIKKYMCNDFVSIDFVIV